MLTFENAFGSPAATPDQTVEIGTTTELVDTPEDYVHPSESVDDITAGDDQTVLLAAKTEVEELADSSVTLQELKDTVVDNITNESFDAGHSRLLTIAIRGIVAQHQLSSAQDLNLESAIVLANTLEGNLSTIGDIQVNLEASIVSGILKAYNAVREEFSEVHRGYGAMTARLKDAERKLKLVSGSGAASVKFNAAHRLSVNGKTDKAAMVDGLVRSNKMAKELVNNFYPNVYKLIDFTTEVVEKSIPNKANKTSTEDQRRIAADGAKKVNDAFKKLMEFSDVGVVSGEAFLEIDGGASGTGKPTVKFKKGDLPDARTEVKLTKADVAQLIKLAQDLVEATNTIYSAHGGFYNRSVRRYEEFNEVYRVNASFLRKFFIPFPLLITYLSFLAGGNGILWVPIEMYSHLFRVSRAVTSLLDNYFKAVNVK